MRIRDELTFPPSIMTCPESMERMAAAGRSAASAVLMAPTSESKSRMMTFSCKEREGKKEEESSEHGFD